MNLQRCKEVLERAGVTFVRGLTEGELRTAEHLHGFAFPPDLRDYLTYALPTGKGFPDWRDPANAAIQDALAWPFEGIKFDIEHAAFWLDEWGPRPSELSAAFEIAAQRVRAAPPLIPIRGHRYLPAIPSMPGNPVFSVYQTDVIYYGATLEDYLHNEYPSSFEPGPFQPPSTIREIAFWSRLVEKNSRLVDENS